MEIPLEGHQGAPGDDVSDRLATALIRHLRKVDAGLLSEKLAGEVRHAANDVGIECLIRLLPTRYKIVIKLKTAKATDITLPDNFVALVDEVIE